MLSKVARAKHFVQSMAKAHLADRSTSPRSAMNCTAVPRESPAPHFTESGVPPPASTRLVWREENGTLAHRRQPFHYKPFPDTLEHVSLRSSNPRTKNLFRNFL